MDIQYLMRQARKLEKAMAEAKEKLGDIAVEAESGGGLVRTTVNGRCEVVKLVIDPKALEPFGAAGGRAGGAAGAVDPGDKAMLEDLVVAAVNAGVEKARAAADEAMAKATGGVKVPGLGG
jgi:DNA-binding protein YbaB